MLSLTLFLKKVSYLVGGWFLLNIRNGSVEPFNNNLNQTTFGHTGSTFVVTDLLIFDSETLNSRADLGLCQSYSQCL